MLDNTRGYQASVEKINMSLYDGVDVDGVPMQSNSTEGTDITKLCKSKDKFRLIICRSMVVPFDTTIEGQNIIYCTSRWTSHAAKIYTCKPTLFY